MPRKNSLTQVAVVQKSHVDHAGIPRVGEMIKRFRQKKGMSLHALAAESGVSTGMLSQIERDQANPSMRTLWRVRKALEIPAGALFGEPEAPAASAPFVRRHNERPKLDFGPSMMVKELLSTASHNQLEVMILNIPSGGSTGDQPLSSPSEKAGLILEGQLTMTVNGTDAVLYEGDSFQFDGLHPHSYRNNSDKMVRVLWIVCQAGLHRHV